MLHIIRNYRTRDQIIEIFENLGYNLEDCFWMHPEDSKLNKWKETKLSVFIFEKLNEKEQYCLGLYRFCQNILFQ